MPNDSRLASCELIINPSRYPQYVKILKRLLKRYPIASVVESADRDEFIRAVKAFYRSDLKYLLVWGGDGTAHCAINALMEAEGEGKSPVKKAVGFLRGGSGNGIQDSYEVPFSIFRQLEAYAESMEREYVIDVDLLRVDDGKASVYGQLAGVGFDVEVLKLRETKQELYEGTKKVVKAGLWNYFHAAARTFFQEDFSERDTFLIRFGEGRYSFQGTRVNAEWRFDSFQREVQPRIIEAGTRPYYGKLFKICPDVVCNDGYIDLYIFNFEDKFSMFLNLVALWNGWHPKINKRFVRRNKPIIERYEIKDLNIVSEVPFYYHVDGELKEVATASDGEYVLSILVVKQTITFLVPKDFYVKFHPFDI